MSGDRGAGQGGARRRPLPGDGRRRRGGHPQRRQARPARRDVRRHQRRERPDGRRAHPALPGRLRPRRGGGAGRRARPGGPHAARARVARPSATGVGPRPRRRRRPTPTARPATGARTAASPATSSCRAPAPSGRCAGSPTCATGSGAWAARRVRSTARPHLVFFLHDEVVVHTPAALADAVAAEVTAAAATAGAPAVPRPRRRLPAQRLGRAVLRRRRQAGAAGAATGGPSSRPTYREQMSDERQDAAEPDLTDMFDADAGPGWCRRVCGSLVSDAGCYPRAALGLARGVQTAPEAHRSQAPWPSGSISPRSTRSSSASRHPLPPAVGVLERDHRLARALLTARFPVVRARPPAAWSRTRAARGRLRLRRMHVAHLPPPGMPLRTPRL